MEGPRGPPGGRGLPGEGAPGLKVGYQIDIDRVLHLTGHINYCPLLPVNIFMFCPGRPRFARGGGGPR